MRRYRWLILAIAVTTFLIGLWLVAGVSPLYSATSSLVLDPPGIELSDAAQDRSDLSPDRYAADQLIILRSGSVAERAAQVATDRLGATAGVLTADDLMEQAEVTVAQDSNVVQIRFLAEDPTEALVGANSLALAYQETRREEIEAATQAAIERVDMLLENVDTDLAAIEDQMSELRIPTEGHPIMERLETQLAASLLRLVELQEQLADADDPENEAAIREEIEDILVQVSIFQTFRSLDEPTPELQGLMRTQEALIDLRSQLSQQRNALAVDAELRSSGVTSYLPAESAHQIESTHPLRTLIVMLVLGAVVGGALAYFLATRRSSSGELPGSVVKDPQGRHVGA